MTTSLHEHKLKRYNQHNFTPAIEKRSTTSTAQSLNPCMLKDAFNLYRRVMRINCCKQSQILEPIVHRQYHPRPAYSQQMSICQRDQQARLKNVSSRCMQNETQPNMSKMANKQHTQRASLDSEQNGTNRTIANLGTSTCKPVWESSQSTQTSD